MFRCEHVYLLSWLDVYICPITIILSVEIDCVMRVIVNGITVVLPLFYIENETKKLEKRLKPNSTFSI